MGMIVSIIGLPAGRESAERVVCTTLVHNVVVRWDGIAATAAKHARGVRSDLLRAEVNGCEAGHDHLTLHRLCGAEGPTRTTLALRIYLQLIVTDAH